MPLLKMKSSKATPTKGISYIIDPNKAELVTSLNMSDNQNYSDQFKQTQQLHNKGGKYNERKYYHVKISADPSDSITPQLSHQLAEKVASQLFPSHECVIATHTDTDVVHSHIIVNAVNFDTGKKLHISDKAY